MLGRERNKKTISEFYTARENHINPISCITNGYRFSAPQDSSQLKYASRTLSKAQSKQELNLEQDKYRIFSGKLHVFQKHTVTYVPVEKNNYIDLLRFTARSKEDFHMKTKRRTPMTPVLWLKSEEPHSNTNLCSRETERQQRSLLTLSSKSATFSRSSQNSLISKNFSTQNTLLYKTPSEILSERCVTSSYTLSR